MPESENPPPREAEPHEEVSAATELDYEEYHQRSDQFLEALVEKLEQIQEEKSEVEVEYAVRQFFIVHIPTRATSSSSYAILYASTPS